MHRIFVASLLQRNHREVLEQKNGVVITRRYLYLTIYCNNMRKKLKYL